MRFWFRCPGCRGLGTIDEDQASGRVPILCKGCGWHRSGLVSPLIPVSDGARGKHTAEFRFEAGGILVR